MKKIAIVTCANIKNELGCPAVGCLAYMNTCKGAFERYKEEGLELVGMTTCAGCPTLLAPDKILTKIKPLVELAEAQVLHLSTCMVNICPFIRKYQSIISKKYPDLEIVSGTDDMGEKTLIKLGMAVKTMLTEGQPDITEEYLKAVPMDEFRKSLSALKYRIYSLSRFRERIRVNIVELMISLHAPSC